MHSSQKRLTGILLALAITGALAIALLWWDSTRYQTDWRSERVGVRSSISNFGVYRDGGPWHLKRFFYVERSAQYSPIFGSPSLFPKPALWSEGIRLPYYLILLTYLATLLLMWLFLMNRIARREEPESRSPEREP